jgi:hypothetical protein
MYLQNVISRKTERKKFFFGDVLKVNDENSRDPDPLVRLRGTDPPHCKIYKMVKKGEKKKEISCVEEQHVHSAAVLFGCVQR